jgi:hypothetical protein
MNRDELHEMYKEKIKDMLHMYTSFFIWGLNDGTKTKEQIIDLFIETHIKKDPDPNWKPEEKNAPN